MQVARDQQKSYADLKRKAMEFQVGDRVMLKISPWKGVVRFGKWGKLNPRYVRPFKVLEKVGTVASSRVEQTVPLEGLHVDDKLHFVEEPVEIMDQEVKRLKQSRILIVKVRWNSRRGAMLMLRYVLRRRVVEVERRMWVFGRAIGGSEVECGLVRRGVSLDEISLLSRDGAEIWEVGCSINHKGDGHGESCIGGDFGKSDGGEYLGVVIII
ncbi:hypothetical protein Tco_0389185 [Tanacetum coccineum]